MAELTLYLPDKAVAALELQVADHNRNAGSSMSLEDYIDTMLLHTAAAPDVADAMPALERARDKSFQESVMTARQDIIDGFLAAKP